MYVCGDQLVKTARHLSGWVGLWSCAWSAFPSNLVDVIGLDGMGLVLFRSDKLWLMWWVGWMVMVVGPVPKVGVNLFWYCRVFLFGPVTRKFSPIVYSDPCWALEGKHQALAFNEPVILVW